MVIRHFQDVPIDAEEMVGAESAKKRVILGEKEGVPNFILRHFEIEPGGYSPLHSHPWEHEVYILSGTGTAIGKDNPPSPIKAGDAILILPDEEHQIKNTGSEPLVFLCIIPKIQDR